MRTFEEIWRQDISDGIGDMLPEQEAQLKAFCQSGFDACAKIKDAEIAAWQTRFPEYEYSHQDGEIREVVMGSNNHALGNLSADEIEAVKAIRREQEDRAARSAFQQKAIATAHAFEMWSAKTGEGLTFSTFVNAFGYQDDDRDGRLIFAAVERIRQAAWPIVS